MHHFTWSSTSGFTGAEVEYILRGYGIKCTRRDVLTPGELGLSVSDKQAVWAEHILSRIVPLTSPMLDPRNEDYAWRANGAMPTPWGAPVRAGDFVGLIVDWIDNLLCFGRNRRNAARWVRGRARRRR